MTKELTDFKVDEKLKAPTQKPSFYLNEKHHRHCEFTMWMYKWDKNAHIPFPSTTTRSYRPMQLDKRKQLQCGQVNGKDSLSVCTSAIAHLESTRRRGDHGLRRGARSHAPTFKETLPWMKWLVSTPSHGVSYNSHRGGPFCSLLLWQNSEAGSLVENRSLFSWQFWRVKSMAPASAQRWEGLGWMMSQPGERWGRESSRCDERPERNSGTEFYLS